MKRIIISLISLCVLMFSSAVASAQEAGSIDKNEVKVSEAWVTREGRTLIVEYDLELGATVISCDMELLMSLDGGRTFNQVPVSGKLAGDIGRITSSGQKRITYDIDSIKEQLAGQKLAFKVQVKNKKTAQDNKGKFFVMGTGSTLKMYGLRAGYVKKFGGYLAYSDHFADYMNGGGFGLFSNWSITGGVMMRATDWLYPYAGAGYGIIQFDNVYLDDFIDKYGYIPDNYNYVYPCYTLIPFEVGAMFKIGPAALSTAVKPIYVPDKGGFLCAFELGLGFCF